MIKSLLYNVLSNYSDLSSVAYYTPGAPENLPSCVMAGQQCHRPQCLTVWPSDSPEVTSPLPFPLSNTVYLRLTNLPAFHKIIMWSVPYIQTFKLRTFSKMQTCLPSNIRASVAYSFSSTISHFLSLLKSATPLPVHSMSTPVCQLLYCTTVLFKVL